MGAAYNDSDGSVLCDAPARTVPPNATEVVNVSLSLNGIEAARERWDAADPLALAPSPHEFVNASLLLALPPLGPTTGGIVVMLHGLALDAGHEPLCVFGVAWTVATRVGAHEGAPGAGLRCLAPSAANAGDAALAASGGAVPLRVSLNGRDYHFAEPLEFRYYPPPLVSSVRPPAGSSTGGTMLTLTGVGFGGASAALLCRFGVEAVAAEPNATDTELRCLTPRATAAAAALEATAADCRAYGDASPLATGDAVQLTPPALYDAEGSAVCEQRPSSGSGRDDDAAYGGATHDGVRHGVRYGAAVHVEASFELRLGRGGDGASISYGGRPPSIGSSCLALHPLIHSHSPLPSHAQPPPPLYPLVHSHHSPLPSRSQASLAPLPSRLKASCRTKAASAQAARASGSSCASTRR